ncbi:MAG: DUF2975 domain-containing protein [Acutalibacteraceae bacterium]
MKHSEKSLKLTLTIVILLSALFAFFLFTAPIIFPWYCELAHKGETATKALIGVFYGCSPSAAITLIYVFKFLKNLEKGEVFTAKSVKYLRILSYTCLSAVPLSLPLCFYFIGAFPIPVAAGFMWLILRIIKNAFEYGSEIKNENDLTV